MKKLLSFIIIINCFYLNLSSQDYIKTGVFGGSGGDFLQGYSIDNNGDLVICGTFQNTADFNMTQGDEALFTAVSKYDMYIAKYDIQGNYKWAIQLNGDPFEHYYVYSITTDQNNNIYIIGSANSWIDLDPSNEEAIVNSEEKRVFFIAKYSPLGEYAWGYAIGNDQTNGSVVGWDVEVDNESEYLYVCGVFNDSTDFDPSENTFNLVPSRFGNFFLAKYSIDGVFVWAKMMSHPTEFGYGTPSQLQIDQENNIYMGGSIFGVFDMDPSDQLYDLTSVGRSDAFLSKYDQNGNFIWAFSFGSTDDDQIINFRYINNKLYTVGSWQDTIDFDPSENTFELISIPYETSGFLSIYDTDGNFQTAIGLMGKMIGENGSGGQVNDVDIDSENNIYLIGSFFGTFDFDPSDQVVELTSTGGISDYDMFLAKYDQNNNYIWAINAGGLSQEQGYYVRANGNENVIAFGYYDGYCDFDPSNEEDWINNNGGHDVYLAWYSQFSGSFINNLNTNEIYSKISPNPFSTSTTIEYELTKPSNVQLTIYDYLGKQVEVIEKSQANGKQQIIWNCEGMPAGVYFYSIQIGNQAGTGKMVLMR